jgi:hypothetical protein
MKFDAESTGILAAYLVIGTMVVTAALIHRRFVR